jgi:hypothetical protein
MEAALKRMIAEAPYDVPCVVDGKEVGVSALWMVGRWLTRRACVV